MRGVVTLAAAQSIPATIPYRPQIVLIAFLVAVITLLLHGLTLPALIRWLWPDGVSNGSDGVELASLSRDLIDAGIDAIDDQLQNEADDPDLTITPEPVIQRAKSSARNSLAPLALRIKKPNMLDAHAEESPAEAYLRLARVALEAQRAALLEERAIGRYSAKTIRAAELALDAHETRITPFTGH